MPTKSQEQPHQSTVTSPQSPQDVPLIPYGISLSWVFGQEKKMNEIQQILFFP